MARDPQEVRFTIIALSKDSYWGTKSSPGKKTKKTLLPNILKCWLYWKIRCWCQGYHSEVMFLLYITCHDLGEILRESECCCATKSISCKDQNLPHILDNYVSCTTLTLHLSLFTWHVWLSINKKEIEHIFQVTEGAQLLFHFGFSDTFCVVIWFLIMCLMTWTKTS